MEFVGSRRNGVMLKCEDNYLYKKSSTSKNIAHGIDCQNKQTDGSSISAL